MNDIDKIFGRIPFVIKELEPDEKEKMLYYAGHDFMEDRIETINGVEYKFYGKRSIDRANARKAITGFGGHADPVVNVGTIGHVDWGRYAYQANLADLPNNIPYLSASSTVDCNLTHEEIVELWAAHVRVTQTPMGGYIQVKQGVSSDYVIAKRALTMSKKLGNPYLGFDNGGLVVAGKVIWILADKEYKRFHTKAASWVLPSKEYVTQVVANYYEAR